MAFWHLGDAYHFGKYGLKRDVTRAVELYERAAERKGKDVEKDTARAIRHYETAAMCGHVRARYNLGLVEGRAENHDVALQHFLIAAKMGHEKSLNCVKEMFMDGYATKADYAEALRGYQSAVEEMKSPDREEAMSWQTRSE